MARKPRIDIPHVLYHIITRGNNRQELFTTDADRYRYLEFLADTQGKFDFRIYAYVLMPNHVHLLCELTSGRLAKCMQVIQQRYAQYVNRRYRRVGHLYQGRYRAILCERDRYLLALVRYLHLNPVRAGLVDDPAAYPWSSHASYLGGPHPPVRLTTAPVLGNFGPSPSKARKSYARFVREGLQMTHTSEYYAVAEQQLLGSDSFVEEVTRPRKAKPTTSSLAPMSVDELLERVSHATNVPVSLILGRYRSANVYHARMLFCHVAVCVAGVPIKTVAEALGRDPSNATRAVAGAAQMDARRRDSLLRAVLTDEGITHKRKPGPNQRSGRH